MTPPKRCPSASRPPLVDVKVRYTNGKYSTFQRDVPQQTAYKLVERLRADPKVNWAYCTEPVVKPYASEAEKVWIQLRSERAGWKDRADNAERERDEWKSMNLAGTLKLAEAQNEAKALREALRPFVEHHAWAKGKFIKTKPPALGPKEIAAARAALAASEPSDGGT